MNTVNATGVHLLQPNTQPHDPEPTIHALHIEQNAPASQKSWVTRHSYITGLAVLALVGVAAYYGYSYFCGSAPFVPATPPLAPSVPFSYSAGTDSQFICFPSDELVSQNTCLLYDQPGNTPFPLPLGTSLTSSEQLHTNSSHLTRSPLSPDSLSQDVCLLSDKAAIEPTCSWCDQFTSDEGMLDRLSHATDILDPGSDLSRMGEMFSEIVWGSKA